jgi:hypothetical protein
MKSWAASLSVALLTLAAPGSTPGQEASSRPTNAPPGLSAPEQVGRYTRGALRDYGTPTLGVAYRYSAGDSTLATVYLYRREEGQRAAPADVALREQASTFKQALGVERGRGVYEAYEIAFEGPDSVRTSGRWVPGYQIGYVFRRGGADYVSFFFVYAVGDAFVKIRGTVPEAGWEQTDLPSFAREVAIRTVAAR